MGAAEFCGIPQQGEELPLVNHRFGKTMHCKWFEKTNLLKEIKNISTENNYHYVSDNISNLYNDHRFLEHRHDQSIFSLIAKKNNFFVIPDETYWNPDWNVSGKNYPIWATRLRPWILLQEKIVRLLKIKI